MAVYESKQLRAPELNVLLLFTPVRLLQCRRYRRRGGVRTVRPQNGWRRNRLTHEPGVRRYQIRIKTELYIYVLYRTTAAVRERGKKGRENKKKTSEKPE